MTQNEGKKAPRERRDRTPNDNLEKSESEDPVGVHILGEEDMKKHFRRSDEKDSDNKGEAENR